MRIRKEFPLKNQLIDRLMYSANLDDRTMVPYPPFHTNQ